MRLIVVPRDRLLALERGCPGFLRALLTLEGEADPRFSVIRSFNEGRSTWHIQVGPHVLTLDSKNIEAMAAAVPIYLVDLVHELQDELSEVMLKPGMMEGVEKLLPFIRSLKKDEPS